MPSSAINTSVTLGANASWTGSTGGLSGFVLDLNGFAWTVAGDGSVAPDNVLGPVRS